MTREAIKKDAQRKRAAIMDQIEKSKDGIAIAVICERTGLTRDSVGFQLQKLKQAKLIYTVGTGTSILWKAEQKPSDIDNHEEPFLQAQSIWQVGFRYFKEFGGAYEAP